MQSRTNVLAGLSEKFAYLSTQQHELDEALRARGCEVPIENVPMLEIEASLAQLNAEWERLRAALRSASSSGASTSAVTRSASTCGAFAGTIATPVVTSVAASTVPRAGPERSDSMGNSGAAPIAGAGVAPSGNNTNSASAPAPLLSRANLESVHAALADIERWLSSLHANLRAKKLVINRALVRIEPNLLVDDDAQVPDEYQEILNRIQVFY